MRRGAGGISFSCLLLLLLFFFFSFAREAKECQEMKWRDKKRKMLTISWKDQGDEDTPCIIPVNIPAKRALVQYCSIYHPNQCMMISIIQVRQRVTPRYEILETDLA